jgi:hypothetical protein
MTELALQRRVVFDAVYVAHGADIAAQLDDRLKALTVTLPAFQVREGSIVLRDGPFAVAR